MSHLHDGDEDLHYEDGSHRWSGGDGTEAGAAKHRSRVEAHKAAHLAAENTGARWWPGKLQKRRQVPPDGGEYRP